VSPAPEARRRIPAAVAADVVNAFVDPVIDVVRACLGIDAKVGTLGTTTEIDPPPMITVMIDLRGTLAGPITCSVSEPLARATAAWFLHEHPDSIDLSTCSFAVAELVNIIAGGAMSRLIEAGYRVELLPPRLPDPDACGRLLIERALEITFDTTMGKLKVVFGLRVAEG